MCELSNQPKTHYNPFNTRKNDPTITLMLYAFKCLSYFFVIPDYIISINYDVSAFTNATNQFF